MTALYIIAGLAIVGVIVWLATSGIWVIAKWIGRKAHADERIDHFFDVEGGLDEAERINLCEKTRPPHAH